MAYGVKITHATKIEDHRCDLVLTRTLLHSRRASVRGLALACMRPTHVRIQEVPSLNCTYGSSEPGVECPLVTCIICAASRRIFVARDGGLWRRTNILVIITSISLVNNNYIKHILWCGRVPRMRKSNIIN